MNYNFDCTYMGALDNIYLANSEGTNNLCTHFYHKGEFGSIVEFITEFDNLMGCDRVESWSLSKDDALFEYPGKRFVKVQRNGNKLYIHGWGKNDFIFWISQFKDTTRTAELYFGYTTLKGSLVEVPLPLGKPQVVYDEYYPYVKPNVDQFYQDYLDSSSNVLILMGEPGTGKTSFIRHMVHKHGLRVNTTTDEGAMKNDEYYVNYITNTCRDLLVIEDADLLLGSRESEQNKVMTKLLNLSDGLARLVGKKIIFSTNLNSVSSIDPALTRPGRCFDVVHFRPLTAFEAAAACAIGGMPPPSDNQKEYTLSELFNNRRPKAQINSLGFSRVG